MKLPLYYPRSLYKYYIHTQALTNLKATDVSLAAVKETKESLYASNKSYEKTIDTLKNQLHEEVTSRKLAVQKRDSLQSHLEEARFKKGEDGGQRGTYYFNLSTSIGFAV